MDSTLKIIIEVTLSVIALAIAAIAAYLIPVLKQIQKTTQTIDQAVQDLNTQIKPILAQTQEAMQDIQIMVNELKDQTHRVGQTVENYRITADRVQRLTALVYDQMEMPILNAVNTLNAFKYGLQVFINKILPH